jgi:predicted  nucleic acid-binding Zn-ribbon protein
MLKCNPGCLRKFLLILFLALLTAGCDPPNAGEKKRLFADIEYIKMEIDKEIVLSNGVFKELTDCENDMSGLEDKQSFKEIEKRKCRYELEKYLRNHRVILPGLIAAGSGTEWAEAAAEIARYADKLSRIEDELSAIENRIYELKKKIGLLKEKHNDYEESIDALKARLKEKLERYDTL